MNNPSGPKAPPIPHDGPRRRPPPPPPDAVRPQRRAHVRYEVKLAAEITLGDDVFTATTRDISEGGVGLDLDRALPEGQEIGLSLFLVVDEVEDERTQPLVVRGFVAWCAEREQGEWTAGVRFADIAAEQKEWLKKFVAYVAAQGG